MVAVSARTDLAACPGAGIAGRAALAALDMAADAVDLVELYSCFPIAVEAYAAELGLPLTRDLTVTGGMPFAGGPYNNYVLQSTARAAELMRQGQGKTALVSSVSGILTKQAYGLWSMAVPAKPFVHADLSAQVAAEIRTTEVLESFSGAARIAGYTVLHARGQAPRAIGLADTPDGRRALVTSEDAGLIARLQESEFVGQNVNVDQNGWLP